MIGNRQLPILGRSAHPYKKMILPSFHVIEVTAGRAAYAVQTNTLLTSDITSTVASGGTVDPSCVSIREVGGTTNKN